jgi:hypothetical protein
MISVTFDKNGTFNKQLRNLVEYSFGFIEGVQRGKQMFMMQLGEGTKLILEQFIDASARQNPESLHHVYEWYQTGSPSARLFDINYTVSNLGLSLMSTFRQSTSVQNGSKEPFYNKARVMEAGIAVRIAPKNTERLVFDVDGTLVATPNPVTVTSPGGASVQGSFGNVFDLFVNRYFTQAIMKTSGLNKKFGDVSTYNKNLQAGLKVGRSAGNSAGYRWITNMGVDR